MAKSEILPDIIVSFVNLYGPPRVYMGKFNEEERTILSKDGVKAIKPAELVFREIREYPYNLGECGGYLPRGLTRQRILSVLRSEHHEIDFPSKERNYDFYG